MSTATPAFQDAEGAAWVARYLEHVRYEKRLAARTLALYTQDLQKLMGFAGQAQLALHQVQPTQVRRWVAQMHAAGRSGRGIALILSGWRGFYAWMGREGLLSVNPTQGVRAPKQARPLPKALSVDEAQRLANHTEPHAPSAWHEARDAAVVELLYSSGLRLAELVALDVQASDAALRGGRGWLDLPAGQVQVQGKGGKRRTVPLGEPARLALLRWLALRDQVTPALGHEGALFLNQRGQRLGARTVWARLRQRSLNAGLSAPVHPHVLRHSAASHLLQSSSDLRAVQEFLGHASISTTQVYTRLDFQHLARVYDSAHPRAKRKP